MHVASCATLRFSLLTAVIAAASSLLFFLPRVYLNCCLNAQITPKHAARVLKCVCTVSRGTARTLNAFLLAEVAELSPHNTMPSTELFQAILGNHTSLIIEGARSSCLQEVLAAPVLSKLQASLRKCLDMVRVACAYSIRLVYLPVGAYGTVVGAFYALLCPFPVLSLSNQFLAIVYLYHA